jgi:hypothetical protein
MKPEHPQPTPLVVLDVVSRDCGYGFDAYALMSDGSRAFHATRLHPTEGQALLEVSKLIAGAGLGG